MLNAETRQRLRQLEFISRHKVEDCLQGRYASLFKGQGLEFAEVREYIPGDDVRYLDWNVSARMGKPYIKRNLEERELTIVFLLDNSSSMRFNGRLGSKADIASQLVALLSFAALRFGHKVGLLRFSNKIDNYIEPQRGRHHILRILSEILDRKSWEQGTDIEGALRYFGRIYHRRAVLFLISDLLIPHLDISSLIRLTGDKITENYKISPSLEKNVQLICQRHDFSVLRVVDPLERELPDIGRVRWRDSETGEVLSVNTSDHNLRKNYELNMRAYGAHWKIVLEKSGGNYGEFSCSEEVLQNLLSFMARKK